MNYDLNQFPAASALPSTRASDPSETTAELVTESVACLESGSPRCASAAVSQNLRFIGRLIGRAVFDGIPLGVPLHPLV